MKRTLIVECDPGETWQSHAHRAVSPAFARWTDLVIVIERGEARVVAYRNPMDAETEALCLFLTNQKKGKQ